MSALMQFPEKLYADESTRVGRMLSAGDIRVTSTDLETGDHITVRFKALLDNRFNGANSTRPRPNEKRNWLRVPIAESSHVFAEVPNPRGDYPDKIGTYYPKTGKWFPDKNADPERVDAAIAAANWIVNGDLTDGLEFHEESNCGVCGRVLTDPESIEKGIGPECSQQQTRSHHQVKNKQKRFPARRESSPFAVSRILNEIETLSTEDQETICNELTLRLKD